MGLFLRIMSDLSVVDDDTATSSLSSSSSSSASLSQEPSKIISARAEEELLDLAQNFLLYVAMVIIVVMVTKIYWPHLLVRYRDRERSLSGGDVDGVNMKMKRYVCVV